MTADNETFSEAVRAGDVLNASKRIVVKVGSAILCGADGRVDEAWLATVAADVVAIREAGHDVVIVTSGAIALGRQRLGLKDKLRLDEKQAASAAGQIALAESWQAAFALHGVTTGQVLLTLEDNEARRRYLNARATISTLLDLGAVPVINENDTVATAEIRYGDNDRLAAHAAQLIEADALVILSDVDGLYTEDPRDNPNARHLPVVEALTPEIEAMATGPNRVAGVGAGGMTTKLAAAKIASGAGCATIIAPGHCANPLRAILNGGKSTLIRAATTRASARRRWIAGRLEPSGSISIDAGAEKALKDGASLLPAGVTEITGGFVRGDAVTVLDAHGAKIGQGLITFDARDLKRLKGEKSSEIEKVLGFRRRPVVIERSDLIFVTKEEKS